LGQIIGGTEGLQYYQKGILLLNQEKESVSFFFSFGKVEMEFF